MSKDKREGWLAEIKVGDEIGVRTSSYNCRLETVTKITPTGRIRTEDSEYSPNGHERNPAFGWNGGFIVPMTPEKKRLLRLNHLIGEIRTKAEHLKNQSDRNAEGVARILETTLQAANDNLKNAIREFRSE